MSLASAITLSSLELTRFFFAMVLILFTAHSFGFLFYEAKLPRVIGEIFGGLVLGPTFLGYFAPDAESWVFGAFSSEGALISVISYFGLVLLMFISGFEIQRSFSKEDRKIATSFLVGATVVPFIIGMLLPYFYNFAPYSGPNGNMLSLAIIVGIGVSVTVDSSDLEDLHRPEDHEHAVRQDSTGDCYGGGCDPVWGVGHRNRGWGFSLGILVSDWLYCICDCRVLWRVLAGPAEVDTLHDKIKV